jgi:hypothetical protein
MRPQLQRQRAFTHLEWSEKQEEPDDERDWEFASTLLLPFEPSTSDDSDLSEDDSSSEYDLHDVTGKPALPSSSVAILQDSVELSVITHPEEQAQPCAVPEDILPYLSLAVTDHGLSRSALCSLKEFWHSRFDEYARVESQVIQNCAYGGIIEANRSRETLRARLISRLTTSRQQQSFSMQPSRPKASPVNMNAAIYPRTGNLSNLHDSRSATLDRAFCNYPLHNIHKTLFLHDMLQRAADYTCHKGLQPSADDNDAEMLADDAFVDISLSNPTSIDLDGCFDSTPSSTHCSLHGCVTPRCDGEYPSTIVHTTECARQWEVDWMERWKVLLDSTKNDSLCFRLNTYSVDEAAFFAALSLENKPKAKFFFAEEYDEFSGLHDDDDEEEDYGLVVTQPVFRVTAETLSKEYLRSLGLDGTV